jgi:hypothetical protein
MLVLDTVQEEDLGPVMPLFDFIKHCVEDRRPVCNPIKEYVSNWLLQMVKLFCPGLLYAPESQSLSY